MPGDNNPIEVLTVAIEGDFSKLLSDVSEGTDKAADKLGELDDAGQKTGMGLKGAAGIAGAAFGLAAGAAGKLLDMVLQLAVAIPQFFANTAKESIALNQQWENFTARFTTLLDGAGAAQTRLSEIQKFAVETPFNLDELVAANVQLQGMGAEALTTGENFRILTDAVAASQAPFENVAMHVGRLYNALMSGRPIGESAAELAQLGLISGDTRNKLEAMQKAGEDGAKIWEFFATTLDEQVGGAAAELSKTLTGIQSNIEDFKEGLLRTGGAEFFDEIKAASQAFLDTLNNNAPQIEEIAKGLGEIGATLVRLFGELVGGFNLKGILDQIQAFVDWLGRTTKAGAAFVAILKAWLSPITEIVGGLGKFLLALTPIGQVVRFLTEEVFPNLDKALIAGAQVLALSAAGFEGLLATLKPIGNVITLIGESIKALASGDFATAGQKAQEALNQIKDGLFDVDAGAQAAKDSLLQSAATIDRLVNPIEEVEDAAQDAAKAVETIGEEGPDPAMLEKLDSLATQMIDAKRERDEQMESLEQSHQEKLADIAEDGAEKRTKIEDDAAKDLAKLTADTEDKRQEILEKGQEALEKLDADSSKELKQRRKENEKEERRATEDHLREMKRLTEQYLFDLSDAVKDRDARAIVDLQRGFKQEQSQREEDFSVDRGRGREDNSQELAQIRDNAAQRRQEIIDSQAQELLDLIEAEEAKKAEIETKRQEELVKLEANLAERYAKEQESYTQRQSAIEESLQKRLETIARGLADEEKITEEGAAAILSTLNDYFGIGGDVDQLMEDFAARRKMKLEIKVDFEKGSTDDTTPGDYFPGPSGGSGGLPVLGPFAQGGTAYADKPTLALFGEAGPEVAQFTPISQLTGTERETFSRGQFDHRVSFDNLPPGMDEAKVGEISAKTMLEALRESGWLVDVKRGG